MNEGAFVLSVSRAMATLDAVSSCRCACSRICSNASCDACAFITPVIIDCPCRLW